MVSARRGQLVFIAIAVLFLCSCNRGKVSSSGSESDQPQPKNPIRATGLRVPDNLADISSRENVRAMRLMSAAAKNTKNLSIKTTLRHPDFCDPTSEAFDFRSAAMITPVKDQGLCGACWAFATNAVLESSYLGLRKEHIDASEQELISCAPPGQYGDRNCESGWWAFDVLEKPGIESTSRYPYTGSDAECKSQPPVEFRILASDYVQPGQKVTQVPPDSSLKAAMCKHGPLAVAFVATPKFTDFGWKNHSPSSIFEESDTGKVNHGVELVGWDKEGWIIKNSWGSQWGDQGF